MGGIWPNTKAARPDKVRVIPNGVDVERFHPRWPNRALRQELDLGPRTRRWWASWRRCGRRRTTNCSFALRRWCRKLPGRPIPGGRRRPERPRLESLAAEPGLADAVRFLGTRHDVPEVLSLVDVLLLLRHAEANPICLLEAMAGEKPVVATRVGSVPETVLGGADRLPGRAGRLRGHGRRGCSNCSATATGPPRWAAPAASR